MSRVSIRRVAESSPSREPSFRHHAFSETPQSSVTFLPATCIKSCVIRAYGIGSGWCTSPAGEAGGRRRRGRSEENKALARRSWESVDAPDTLGEVYTSDVVWHMPDQEVRGIEEAKQFIAMFKTAFPDMQATVEDVVAEGDKVVTRVTIRGTHQGESEEFGPATGGQVETEGITIHRIEGGKIAEEWNSYDNLSLLQQLGLAPVEQ